MRGEADTQRTEDTTPPRLPSQVVIRGILPGDASRAELRQAGFVFGRGEDCDLRLDHPRVSRRHAEIRAQGPLVTIRDLASTNGTYVDGLRISHAALESSMLVRLGDWLGVVDEDDAASERVFGELSAGLWGGPGLSRVAKLVFAAARSDLPVILVGASGTGKERFARALHAESGRAGAFHAINCAALPEALAEAQLFGYRRGAFTGAERNHVGHFRAADGGTLLLDEIPELSPALQAKVLRAVEHREVIPLGETDPVAFDARIVVASQCSLADLVMLGKFREDLAARLSGLTIELPALRERRGDIPGLFWNFVRAYAGTNPPAVSTRLYEALCLHDWPGNVRELELLARRLLALHAGERVLRRSHLPLAFQRAPEPRTPSSKPPGLNLQDLCDALAKTRGNVRHAAALVGISRQRAYRLISSGQLRNAVSAARNDAIREPDGAADRNA
jgi:transcriptional regulator of acetoin/glycerol metabolism